MKSKDKQIRELERQRDRFRNMNEAFVWGLVACVTIIIFLLVNTFNKDVYEDTLKSQLQSLSGESSYYW